MKFEWEDQPSKMMAFGRSFLVETSGQGQTKTLKTSCKNAPAIYLSLLFALHSGYFFHPRSSGRH
jgi:hypothetical protein